MRWVGTCPQNIVAGAVEALHDNDRIDHLHLVGDQGRIEAELHKLGVSDNRIEIVHATEVIEMDDSPVLAVRRKKDSSMSRAIDLVKSGKADAIVSAGNTGALLTASHLKLRTLEVSIDRAWRCYYRRLKIFPSSWMRVPISSRRPPTLSSTPLWAVCIPSKFLDAYGRGSPSCQLAPRK